MYTTPDHLLALAKSALAALSQPRTFPADIVLAKKRLTALISLLEGKQQ